MGIQDNLHKLYHNQTYILLLCSVIGRYCHRPHMNLTQSLRKELIEYDDITMSTLIMDFDYF